MNERIYNGEVDYTELTITINAEGYDFASISNVEVYAEDIQTGVRYQIDPSDVHVH